MKNQRKEAIMGKMRNTVTLATVHTHTHTHNEIVNIDAKTHVIYACIKSIRLYVFLSYLWIGSPSTNLAQDKPRSTNKKTG